MRAHAAWLASLALACDGPPDTVAIADHADAGDDAPAGAIAALPPPAPSLTCFAPSTRLASVGRMRGDLLADAGSLYSFEQVGRGWQLVRRGLDGTAPSPLAEVESPVPGLQQDAARLWWVEASAPGERTVWSVAKDGGEPTVHSYPGISRAIEAIAVDGEHLFVAELGRVVRTSASGGGLAVLWGTGAFDLALDGSAVYLRTWNDVLLALPRCGGQPTEIADAAFMSSRLAVGSGQVYWTERPPDGVAALHAAAPQDATNSILLAFPGAAGDLRATPGWVYLRAISGDGFYLLRVPESGGAPQVLCSAPAATPIEAYTLAGDRLVVAAAGSLLALPPPR